jgi:hypothetical protein
MRLEGALAGFPDSLTFMKYLECGNTESLPSRRLGLVLNSELALIILATFSGGGGGRQAQVDSCAQNYRPSFRENKPKKARFQ